ncbi:MAG: hypothetical protein IJQ76_07295 [Prevotella sp.]|nr:hypothetical protein [Prevotella sp.]
MKRITIIALTLVSASSVFAYYGDYDYASYSTPKMEMPWWIVFMSIVMIIWGILNIILFFKLWGMTNDVNILKEELIGKTTFNNRSEKVVFLWKSLVEGKTDRVKRELLKNFVVNVKTAYGKIPSGDYVKQEDGSTKWVDYKEKKMNTSIRPYVENLMMQYARFDAEVPAYIKRMQTFGDFYNIFDLKDLDVEKTENANE